MSGPDVLAILLEAVHLVALLAVGSVVVRREGGWGAARPAVALLAGISLHVVVGGAVVAAVAFGAPAPPWLVTPALVLLGAFAARAATRSGPSRNVSSWRFPEPRMAVAAVVLALLAVGVRALRLASIGPDAVEYLAGARLLGLGAADLLVTAPSYLERRSVALQVLHAPLAALDLGGAFALGPAALLAVLLLVAVLVDRLAAAQVDPPWPRRLAVLAVLSLVTLERVLSAATRGNGHQIVAGVVLLVVAAGLFATGPRGAGSTPARPRDAAILAALAVGALVLLRPEGALLGLLLLVPTAASLGRTDVLDRWPWYGLGAVTVAWQSALIAVHATVGVEVGARNLLQLVLGAAALAAPALVGRAPVRLRRLVPIAAAAVLGAALVAHAILAPHVLRRSVGATAINLVDEGRWGGAFPILAVLVLVAVLAEVRARLRGEPPDPAWSRVRFPVVAFPVFGILLGLLRDAPFRIGPADSLNRMWLHVVPLVVLVVASGLSDEGGARPAGAAAGAAAGGAEPGDARDVGRRRADAAD